MTELAGGICARQIQEPYNTLARVLADVLMSQRLAQGTRPAHELDRDLDRVLEATSGLMYVIGQHVRPRCASIGPPGPCLKPEEHGSDHGDGIFRW